MKRKNRSDKLKETWYSSQLDKIPNYNVNFSNWVDGEYLKGQLKIEIFKENNLSIKVELFAPYGFAGGDEGYLKIQTLVIDNPSKEIRCETKDLLLIEMKRSEEIVLNAFGSEFSFKKYVTIKIK